MEIPAGMENRYYEAPDEPTDMDEACDHEPRCEDMHEHDELLREDAAIDAEDARREEGYY